MTRFGISGHQSAPEEAWVFVTSRLTERLRAERQPIGVSSLAAGADQLFARLILEAGGQLEVVLPSHRYETSFGSPRDRESFQGLLGHAARVETLSFPEPSEEAYLAAGKRIVDSCDVLIAVWDGKAARGKGGTADVVDYAKSRRKPVEIVWPVGVER